MVSRLGIDTNEDVDILQRAIAIASTYRELLDGSTWPAADGSELARLNALICSNISLTDTVVAGQRTAVACVLHLSELLEQGLEPRASVAVPLSRTALVSAAHVIYALGPEDPDVRLRNARIILHVQATSHLSAIEAYSQFEQLGALRPPPTLSVELKKLRSAVAGTRRPEGQIIQEMADAIAQGLVRSEHDDHSSADVLREHFTWLWHNWSGVAHGWAWPHYVPGLSDEDHVVAPGHWITDFLQLTSVVQLAVTLVVEALDHDSGAPGPRS